MKIQNKTPEDLALLAKNKTQCKIPMTPNDAVTEIFKILMKTGMNIDPKSAESYFTEYEINGFEEIKNASISEDEKGIIQERNKKTLARLRQQGLCTETSGNEIRNNLFSKTGAAEKNAIGLDIEAITLAAYTESLSYSYNIIDAGLIEPTDDECDRIWTDAIMAVLMLTERKQIEDLTVRNFALAAKKHLYEIYLLAAILFSLYTSYSFLQEKSANWMELIKEATQNVEDYEEERQQRFDKEVEEQTAELTRENAVLKSTVKEMKAHLEADKRETGKMISRLTREARDKNAEICKLQEQIAVLTKENEKLQEEWKFAMDCVKGNRRIDETKTVTLEPDGIETIEEIKEPLPDKKVLFLGGHTNLHKKLRKRYPNWIYITPDEKGTNAAISASFIGAGNPDYIVYFTAHTSHLLEDILKKTLVNTPVIYVTSTNIDRIEDEIRQGITAAKEK